MDPKFWHDRWADGQTGWHRAETNPNLVNHWATLGLKKGSRVMVPLCGKTVDIGWLAAQGHDVVGAELDETAVTELFEELGVIPTITQTAAHKRFSAPQVDVYVGNIFDLTPELVGRVDAIYDRAALYALPLELRTRYSAHLRHLTGTATQLLCGFEYDQSKLEGPPFSVGLTEIEAQYRDHYTIAELDRYTVDTGKWEEIGAVETVWQLTAK